MHLLESAGLSPKAGLASELFRLSVFETAWLRDFANSRRRWIWEGTGALGGGLNSLPSWNVEEEPLLLQSMFLTWEGLEPGILSRSEQLLRLSSSETQES